MIRKTLSPVRKRGRPALVPAPIVLDRIRALARRGAGLFRVHRRQPALYARARRQFGSWGAAVAAAGLDHRLAVDRARTRAAQSRRRPRRLAIAFAIASLMPLPSAVHAQVTDSLAARLETLGETVAGMNEQLQTLQTDTDKLKRFKFSGYLQVRWETAENRSDTVRVAGSPATFTPANPERIYIRRGRLKLTYDSGPLSQAVVYFDGGTDRTIRLLEAYVTLLDPWTPDHRHGLTVGQMNVPFGWEIERSSSVRELPERSRAENVLFSGERDRGIKLNSQWTDQLQTTFGVFNGGGINDPEFPNTDPTRRKDWTARGRVNLGRIEGGASWYAGAGVVALTGGDLETERTRMGLDAELYFELPGLGGGSLRGESYGGETVNPDSVRVLIVAPTSANPVRLLAAGADPTHLDTDFRGLYVMAVQNFGEKLQGAARWETFDPNTDLDHDQFERVSLGLHWFYDGYTRITVAYDIPTTDRALGGGRFDDPKDNLWTVQFQHKF